MSDENSFDSFSKVVMNFLQLEVKHIYYGNITKAFAKKSMVRLIETFLEGDSKVKENIEIWACEYLANCATKRNLVEWHDLRKKPDDLPPAEGKDGHYSITVLNERLDKVFYDFKTKEWKEPVFGDKQRAPKAWYCGYYFKTQDGEDEDE
jgi:hypothetical protein